MFISSKITPLATTLALALGAGPFARAENKVFLSIDAGGMFGLIPALLIEDLETKLKVPVSQSVDGMMGTSTGAILSALATAPVQADGSPYPGRDIVGFYKTKGPAVFESAIAGAMARIFSGMFGQPAPDTAATLRTELSGVLRNTTLAEAVVPLYIHSYDQTRSDFFNFDSCLARGEAGQNTFMWSAVLASSSVSAAFGAATVTFNDGNQRDFVDAGEHGVCNASEALYRIVKAGLAADDEATIFSLGTGFSAGCTFQPEANSRITLVRLEPDMRTIVPANANMIVLNALAANAKPEQIAKLEAVAEGVKQTSEYARLLQALHARAQVKGAASAPAAAAASAAPQKPATGDVGVD